MNNGQVIEIQSNDDVRVSIQCSTPRIFSASGETQGEPEVVLLLEELSFDAEPAPWIEASFTEQQLCGLIDALEEMRQQLRA